ncbi:hypothetical protein [Pseudomonas ovata]|nr:hypothetical protein [Pseudomonas ovata]
MKVKIGAARGKAASVPQGRREWPMRLFFVQPAIFNRFFCAKVRKT